VNERRIEQSMKIVELSIFRWMSEVEKEDKIRNEYVRGSIGVASIIDEMKDSRLRWLGM